MTKKAFTVLLGLTAAAAVTGCSNDKTSSETSVSTESASLPEDTADTGTEETETETETERPIEPITPEDYLAKDAASYVTVGPTDNLQATEYTYEITDDMVQEQIESDRLMVSEEVEVDRPARSGDVVYFNMTYTANGGTATEESTYVTLGNAEYGEDLDRELTGLSVGDTASFSASFDDTAPFDNWYDTTVSFQIEVLSVCEVHMPDYTDEFVQEYTVCSTIEEYEKAVRDALTEEYEESARADVVDALITQAIEQSAYSGYPQELYDSCLEELTAQYQSFADSIGEEDFYSALDLTEEDLSQEALDLVNRRLFLSAVSLAENITVTQEEYMALLEEGADYYGYASAADYEDDYSRPSIVWSLYEQKVGDFLYESAAITKEPYVEEELDPDDIEVIETEVPDDMDISETEVPDDMDMSETEIPDDME